MNACSEKSGEAEEAKRVGGAEQIEADGVAGKRNRSKRHRISIGIEHQAGYRSAQQHDVHDYRLVNTDQSDGTG
jgi:hypothetical protein